MTHTQISISGCLVALALTGCAAPRAVESPAPVPAAFSQPGATPLPAQWWTAFEDPALTELINRALRDNFTLRRAWDRLAQAEAVARREGAAFWPTLDGTAGARHTIERAPVTPPPGRRTTSFDQFSLGAVAGYELDLWGRVRATRRAAALDARASAADVQAAATTVAATVATVWYQLVEQHGQLELLDAQLATNESVLELVTLRFRRGQVGAADVLQQQQLVEARRGDQAIARARIAVREHALAALLGQPPTEPVAARVASLPALPALPATGVPAELLQRRPDVRARFDAALAADRRAAAALADRFPKISLSAGVDTSARRTRDLFDNWLASVAANLVAPLFDAGERAAEVARARAVVSERVHAYGSVVLEALREVEDALAQEAQQHQLLASLDKQLAISARVMERTRDRYVNGAVDYLRVLDVLLTHQALERNRLQAQRQLCELRISLCRALAGGWELPRPELATVEARQ